MEHKNRVSKNRFISVRVWDDLKQRTVKIEAREIDKKTTGPFCTNKKKKNYGVLF